MIDGAGRVERAMRRRVVAARIKPDLVVPAKAGTQRRLHARRRAATTRSSFFACVLACLSFASPAAHATTYRCEVDGRTLYSDVPCAVGKQSTIATDDTVTAAERAAAAARLRNDKATLAEIERERVRQRQEDLRLAARNRRPDRDTAKHTQACLKLSRRARDAHDQFDLASPRDQPKARLKMQRADEDYATLCKR